MFYYLSRDIFSWHEWMNTNWLNELHLSETWIHVVICLYYDSWYHHSKPSLIALRCWLFLVWRGLPTVSPTPCRASLKALHGVAIYNSVFIYQCIIHFWSWNSRKYDIVFAVVDKQRKRENTNDRTNHNFSLFIKCK